MHVTRRTLSFGQKIFNLNSKLKIVNSVPQLYRGEKASDQTIPDIKKKSILEESEESEAESESDVIEESESENKWRTQSVQGWALTSCMIA